METTTEDPKDDQEDPTSKPGSDVLNSKSPRRKTSWWNGLRSLTRNDDNQTPGLRDALAKVCAHDDTVEVAYLCHSSVIHVSEERRLDSFCGYRNIQMLMSFAQAQRMISSDLFESSLPSIPELQDTIEHAWAKGINTYGRDAVGSLQGTKKYIGTAEVQACLRGIGIRCKGQVFGKTEDGQPAERRLLEFVDSYFGSCQWAGTTNVVHTDLPPIYLQLPRHSITIVGIERKRNGSLNLLVFDPAVWPSKAMKQLVSKRQNGDDGFDATGMRSHCSRLLTPYRRDEAFLRKRGKFEILFLTGLWYTAGCE